MNMDRSFGRRPTRYESERGLCAAGVDKVRSDTAVLSGEQLVRFQQWWDEKRDLDPVIWGAQALDECHDANHVGP